MTLQAELDKTLSKLVEERKQVELVTQQAHQAIKDGRQVLKEIEAAKKELAKLAEDSVSTLLQPIVEAKIIELIEVIEHTKAETTRRMFKMFEELTNTIFTGNKKGLGEDLRIALAKVAQED